MKEELLKKNVLKNPEELLVRFLREIKYLHLDDMILLIDNFDQEGYSSKQYQESLYELLRGRIKSVFAISDDLVLDNKEYLDNMVVVYYSKNIFVVKKILENELTRLSYLEGNKKIIYLIDFILKEETIKEMIIIANGNLFDMLMAIRYLYNNMFRLKQNEYDSVILNYLDKEINKDSLLTGIIKRERKLHIEHL